MGLETIKKREDFLKAQAGAKAGSATMLVIRGLAPNGRMEARVGFTVTKKIGGAVVRNRIRRRLREAARVLFPDYATPSFDYVVIARDGAAQKAYPALLDDMKRALLRLSAHPK